MITITGDLHGSYERIRLYESSYKDFVIVCGDFGVIWDGGFFEKGDLDEMNEYEVTTLFLDGNHENYDLLKQYPIREWHGGKVQFIREHVIHLMRGEIYEIDGHTFFVMGGAQCHDAEGGVFNRDDPDFQKKLELAVSRRLNYRINHESWWKEELPSEEEMEEGLTNLAKRNNQVDVILTHCAPLSIQEEIVSDFYPRNELTDYLEQIKDTIYYQYWFFGHYHEDRQIDAKHFVMYKGRRYIDETLTITPYKEFPDNLNP